MLKWGWAPCQPLSSQLGTPGYPEENPTFFEDGESESSGRGKASAMGWKSMMQLCG